MKFFKSSLAIVALLVANPMFAARSTTAAKAAPTAKGKAGARGRGKAAPAPVQQVAVPVKTYKQLVDDVKNARDAWNNATKKLNASFTDRIASSALAADLEDYQLDSLLQMARDYHAIFTGNPSEDRDILNNLAQERQAIVEWFNMGKQQKMGQ